MDNNILLGQWAVGVWNDLGQPANVTATTISGYAIQPSTLGRLNDLIGSCYSGSGYTGGNTINFQIGPDISNTELGLIEKMYLVSYYNNLAQSTMGIGGSTIPWTRLREGDSSIDRANAANIGREYREMAKTANEQLYYMVNAYRSNSLGGNLGRSVDYPNIVYPTWTDTYRGP